MANPEHLEILRQGVEAWNRWREDSPNVWPDLSEADLTGAKLEGANLSLANLIGATLHRANLIGADLSQSNINEADLSRADLREADLIAATLWHANLARAMLREAKLSQASLIGANLSGADLSVADLSRAELSGAVLVGAVLMGANLSNADLSGAVLIEAVLWHATLVEANLTNANLSGCRVYGLSAWQLVLHETEQNDLIITRHDEPVVTVDNIEVAQFIYLLLHNEKIRDVIKTVTSKVVLILGRFTKERKAVLDVMRDELRRRDLLPVLFDFERPESRDLTETVSTLAHLARFIIADITDAKSIPQELQAIVPNLPSVAVQPVLKIGSSEYALFERFKRYPWVLPVYQYEDMQSLLAALPERVIGPAQAKADQLQGKL